jgi:hypothetical protein
MGLWHYGSRTWRPAIRPTRVLRRSAAPLPERCQAGKVLNWLAYWSEHAETRTRKREQVVHVTKRPLLSDCKVTAERATRHAGHASSGALATAPTRASAPSRSDSLTTAGRAPGCSARSRSTRLRVVSVVVLDDSGSISARISDDSSFKVLTPGSD